MKALILNSGMGTRLGNLTKQSPKCLTNINDNDTILSRQLRLLSQCGINDVVITTGPFEEMIIDHCGKLNLPLKYTFINNPIYRDTNYIYSIFKAKDELKDDILLMHGDLVFSDEALKRVLNSKTSCMAIDFNAPLPQKDFKAVIKQGRISKIGIEFFENAAAAQPLYKLLKDDWAIWLYEICEFCKSEKIKCYAENAFNMVSDKCLIYPVDISGTLCREVDTLEDLTQVREYLIGI